MKHADRLTCARCVLSCFVVALRVPSLFVAHRFQHPTLARVCLHRTKKDRRTLCVCEWVLVKKQTERQIDRQTDRSVKNGAKCGLPQNGQMPWIAKWTLFHSTFFHWAATHSIVRFRFVDSTCLAAKQSITAAADSWRAGKKETMLLLLLLLLAPTLSSNSRVSLSFFLASLAKTYTHKHTPLSFVPPVTNVAATLRGCTWASPKASLKEGAKERGIALSLFLQFVQSTIYACKNENRKQFFCRISRERRAMFLGTNRPGRVHLDFVRRCLIGKYCWRKAKANNVG